MLFLINPVISKFDVFVFNKCRFLVEKYTCAGNSALFLLQS